MIPARVSKRTVVHSPHDLYHILLGIFESNDPVSFAFAEHLRRFEILTCKGQFYFVRYFFVPEDSLRIVQKRMFCQVAAKPAIPGFTVSFGRFTEGSDLLDCILPDGKSFLLRLQFCDLKQC